VTFLTASDGIAIAVEDHDLRAPRSRIVIVHGYAEHRGRYADLVSRLAPQGFECHLFDLRGHGHSGGIPAHVARFEQYLDDLQRVVARTRSRMDLPTPLFLIGHSLGGLIALEFCRANENSCDGLVVSSPFLRPAFHIPMVKKILAWGASRIAPTLPFDNTLNPKWLSTDQKVAEAYASDPLVKRTTTPRWFTEVRSAQQALRDHAAEIRLPLLMLLAADDRIADHHAAEVVFAAIGSADKTLEVYPGLRHEIFNEVERAMVINDVISWITPRT